jgi:hypothetical protein
MRNLMRRSSGTSGSRSATPRWISTAQRTASTTLWNCSSRGWDLGLADSPVEGDGFEPSVPVAREPDYIAEGELRGDRDGRPKNLVGYRWFESISLLRRVSCEPGERVFTVVPTPRHAE